MAVVVFALHAGALDVMSTEGELLAAEVDGVHRLAYRFGPDPDSGALLEHQRLLEDYFAYRLTRSRLRPVIYAEMETSLALLVREDGRWAVGGRVEGIDVRPHHVAEDADGRVWVGTSALPILSPFRSKTAESSRWRSGPLEYSASMPRTSTSSPDRTSAPARPWAPASSAPSRWSTCPRQRESVALRCAFLPMTHRAIGKLN